MRRPGAVASLDKPVGEDGQTPFGDLLESDASEPGEQVEASMRCEAVRHALAKLPGAERDVLSLRYGIGCHPRTLDDVAGRLAYRETACGAWRRAASHSSGAGPRSPRCTEQPALGARPLKRSARQMRRALRGLTIYDSPVP